jgi:hypothetical protein
VREQRRREAGVQVTASTDSARRRGVRSRRPECAALVLVAAAFFPACFPTTVRSGRPAMPSTETTTWHHAFLFGLVEASGPYVLDEICPQGWSEFYTEIPAAAGVLRVLTLGLYTPGQVRIVCAAPDGVDVNSLSEGPVPEFGMRGDAPPRTTSATPVDGADAGAR